MSKGEILVARKTAVMQVGDQRVTIRKGITRVREGHPLLEGREDMFEPISVHYDVEQATAEPGEKRELPIDQAVVRAWAKEQGIDVPARGKIPAAVVERYKAEHQGQ